MTVRCPFCDAMLTAEDTSTLRVAVLQHLLKCERAPATITVAEIDRIAQRLIADATHEAGE